MSFGQASYTNENPGWIDQYEGVPRFQRGFQFGRVARHPGGLVKKGRHVHFSAL